MAEAKSQMEDAGEAAFYRKIYNDAQEALDKILGTEEEDGAGDGLVADIYLVAEQRDEARSELARVRTQVAAELRAYAEYLRANGLLAVAVDVVRHGADRVECRRCPEGICSAHIPLPSGTVGTDNQESGS